MKPQLRKKFINLRKKKYFELNLEQVNSISSFLSKIIKQFKIKIIGGYYPINFEINILPILELLKKQCSVALPTVLQNNKMDFRIWNEHDPLFVNKFGILEPSKKNKKVIPQLFLTPLLAFDQKLNRLGYGRGYYDRYLIKNKKFLTFGVAFSFQQIKTVPVYKNDVSLKGIITEQDNWMQK